MITERALIALAILFVICTVVAALTAFSDLGERYWPQLRAWYEERAAIRRERRTRRRLQRDLIRDPPDEHCQRTSDHRTQLLRTPRNYIP